MKNPKLRNQFYVTKAKMTCRWVSLVLIALSMVGTAYALEVNGQELLNRRITLVAQEEEVGKVLKGIEKAADVRFMYSYELIQAARKVSLQAQDEPLETVLERLLKPLQLSYEVTKRHILIKRSTGNNPLDNASSSVGSSVLEKAIRGKVTDEKGEGIPGVNVIIKNSMNGTITDEKGQYNLNVPDESAVLVFSFVGYVAREITVGNQQEINVQLQPDEKTLEEVVVVGYGVQKKVNMTGAVSTVDAQAIENRPVPNLANALQGVTPGLTIARQTGQPGRDNLSIQIRGVTSANGNVNPLVVMDGVSVPTNTLQTINPNDVESISVLKDAAAAAIYGAQAAGGVILITTKKGKAGKVTFDYLAQQGIDWSINVPDRMTLLEEAEFSNLARKNSGSAPEYTDEDLQRIRDGIPYVVNPLDTGTYLYYNQKSLSEQLLRKYTSMQTHNLTARGGTDKLNFLISGGYYNKQGVFKVGPDNYRRYNLRINLGSQLTKHLSLDSRLSYSNERTESSSIDANGGGLMYQVYRLRTRTPFFTPEGRYNGAGSAATAYGALEAGGYNNYRQNFFDGVFTAALTDVVKGLQLRAVAGTQYRLGDRQVFNRTVPLWGKSRVLGYINQVNSYQISDELTKNLNLQFLANYDFKLGEKNNFGLFAGYQWEDYRFESLTTAANNLVSNDLPTLNLGDDRTKSNSQNIGTNAYQSAFGRFNYNFANKYLFEATVRVDESSKLAPGSRVKVFPAASVGWNLHQEPWFNQTLRFFSEFKLRGSWGRLGGALGDAIGNYSYLSLLNRGNNLVLGDQRTSFIRQDVLASTFISWETIETSNGGVDLGFFQNKLQFSGDYYVKYNRNMLTAQQVPATIGIGTGRKNNGELKSWGWEAELRYRNAIGKGFTYQLAVNLSDNNNRLLNFSNRTVIGAGTNNTIEGYPINTIWGYQTDGYFQTEDEVKAWAFQDNRTGPGDVRYIDQNGDGRLSVGKGTTEDHGDLILLGTTNPRYLFGVTLGAQWKGFDFSAFFQGVGKRHYRPNPESIAPLLVTWKQALGIHRDYWTPENTDALFPRPFVGASHNYLSSDKWVMNAQYVRLKNIQIGYTLPMSFTQKFYVSRARFFFSGQDLFTLSGLGAFQGYYDPETRDNVENDYPFFATASVGLNVSF